MKTVLKPLLAFVLLILVAMTVAAGSPQNFILQLQNAGTLISTFANYGVLNCSTGMTCTASGSTVTLTASGSGVSSVTGTTGLITSTGGATPVISLDPASGSGVDSGSGTAYVVTGGAITSLTPTGTIECFLPLNANSGTTPTVAFNGLTAKTIVKLTGAALAISDMVTTVSACMVYGGSTMYLLNPQGATGTGKPVLQGAPSFTSGFTTLSITTSGNCAAVGTSAQPSVVSCAGAVAGRFSCSTSATSSCQINTTAVTASSDIVVLQTANTAVGTALSVTCNTATSTLLPMVTSQSTGASFTIQLTQPVTNPDCFTFLIVN